LPQLGGELFLTDGGIETTLIFLERIELPDFAAFVLLKSEPGQAALLKYFRSYAELAVRFGTGVILESPTWRASADWGARLGYSCADIAAANQSAIELLVRVRDEYRDRVQPIVISGCVGPRGDGYVPANAMTIAQAREYHAHQIGAFAATDAELISAITMNYVDEAIGLTLAAQDAGMPAVISFTVETDGHLPTGQSLAAAIEAVDQATGGYPAYFMINCAHPTHFEHLLTRPAPWTQRIRGLRANASCKSHAELNEATELDIGDPVELAEQYARLRERLPQLTVLGGCCGTDYRHIEQIAAACLTGRR
jgi:S-methylmethionine-dependent homocysteine/selenocysteine methylase